MIPAVKIFSLLTLSAVILGAAKLLTPQNTLPKMIINNQTIEVEIANTPAKIVQGLSGRARLAENQGMLFIFEQSGRPVFWMKDMKFDLDFVFINDNVIVDLAENIPHPLVGQEPPTVRETQSFDKVLEINAGQIKKLNLEIGNKIQISI